MTTTAKLPHIARRTVPVIRQEVCRACNGYGWLYELTVRRDLTEPAKEICTECNGEGAVAR